MGKDHECKYTLEHLWVRREGEEVRIGITNYGQRMLIRVNAVDLPELGKEISRGQVLAVLHAIKSAVELPSPLTGLVTEVNNQLLDRPWRVNSDPYGSGWLVKMSIADPRELEDLLDEGTYNEKFPWSQWQARLFQKYRKMGNG